MIKRIIKGRLKALTGLHIGSGEVGKVTDAPVYRNIDGEIIIPSTTLAVLYGVGNETYSSPGTQKMYSIRGRW